MDFKWNLNSESVDQCDPDEPFCLEPEVSVSEAVRHMKQHNRGAVLICQNQAVVGIFTERDVLRLMAEGADFEQPLSVCMTPDPVLLRQGDSVGRAITLMAKGGYRRLPIVDERGRPTGIIKIQQIMHFLVEHVPAVVYNLPPEPHQATEKREGA